ncbi:MAG: hypothetical protein JOZ58_01300 [Acetobacteraceae bacterium]|nr:hypothetical protein [Acetobacteraceae bacterium]
MYYTLGEASKATGMSKAALSRAIKNGTISAEKQTDGSFKIDPAELHRVYPPVAEKQVNDAMGATLGNGHGNGELQAKLDAATQRLAELKDEIADMREDRDRWRSAAERLLLTVQRPVAEPVVQEPPPTKRRWRLWGGG